MWACAQRLHYEWPGGERHRSCMRCSQARQASQLHSSPRHPPPFPACSDALESHVAAVVGAEVSRTLAKCGLAEVVARLQVVQVGVQGACVPLPQYMTWLASMRWRLRGECPQLALNCAPRASDAAGAGRPPQTSLWQQTLCIDLISHCLCPAPPFPPSSGAGRQHGPSPGGRPRSAAGAGGGRHAHLLCPPVRPSNAAGAAQAAGKWANLKIGSGLCGDMLLLLLLLLLLLPPPLPPPLYLHVCSADLCLWLLPLCAGAAAQGGGYTAGTAGAGGCVRHRCVLCLLCPLWSLWCRASAPILKGGTECRSACHAPPAALLNSLPLNKACLAAGDRRCAPRTRPAAVHAALNDPTSGYPAAEVAESVRHTPAQVRTLLGVV